MWKGASQKLFSNKAHIIQRQVDRHAGYLYLGTVAHVLLCTVVHQLKGMRPPSGALSLLSIPF